MSSPSNWAKPIIKFDKLDDLPKKPYTPEEIMAAMKILYRQVHAQSEAYGGKDSKLLPVGIAESLHRQVAQLSESFDSKITPHKVVARNSTFRAIATIGPRDIIFRDAEEEPGTWGVVFTERNEKGETHKVTGSGSQMQVLSFIIDMLKEVIARYAPQILNFTSDEASRTKAYDAVIKRLAKDYDVKKITNGDKVEYVLTKKN